MKCCLHQIQQLPSFTKNQFVNLNFFLEKMIGGFGYGSRNQEGEEVLDFAVAFDLMIANTLFRKRESHLVTFSSKQHSSQINCPHKKKGQTSMLGLQGHTRGVLFLNISFWWQTFVFRCVPVGINKLRLKEQSGGN